MSLPLETLMKAILCGEAEPEELDGWEVSMGFHFYNIAKKFMDAQTPGWREILDMDYPPRIAELIKLECIRIHRIRTAAKIKAVAVQRAQIVASGGPKSDWADWV